MLNGETRPLARLLVVEEQVGLGEERRKAVSDAKTLGSLLGVIRTACAPAIKLRTACVEMANVSDNTRNGDDGAPKSPNQRVIDIDINGERHGFDYRLVTGNASNA